MTTEPELDPAWVPVSFNPIATLFRRADGGWVLEWDWSDSLLEDEHDDEALDSTTACDVIDARTKSLPQTPWRAGLLRSPMQPIPDRRKVSHG